MTLEDKVNSLNSQVQSYIVSSEEIIYSDKLKANDVSVNENLKANFSNIDNSILNDVEVNVIRGQNVETNYYSNFENSNFINTIITNGQMSNQIWTNTRIHGALHVQSVETHHLDDLHLVDCTLANNFTVSNKAELNTFILGQDLEVNKATVNNILINDFSNLNSVNIRYVNDNSFTNIYTNINFLNSNIAIINNFKVENFTANNLFVNTLELNDITTSNLRLSGSNGYVKASYNQITSSENTNLVNGDLSYKAFDNTNTNLNLRIENQTNYINSQEQNVAQKIIDVENSVSNFITNEVSNTSNFIIQTEENVNIVVNEIANNIYENSDLKHYQDTYNNVVDVSANSLKNMVNYPVLTNNYTSKILTGSGITTHFFDVGYNGNLINGGTLQNNFAPDTGRYFVGTELELQGRTFNNNTYIITIPGFVWSLSNGNLFQAYSGAISLEQAYNYIPLNLVYANNLFQGDSNLNMPIVFNSNTIHYMRNALNGCPKIESINIGVSNQLDIHSVCENGSGLKDVNIHSEEENSRIHSASYAFYQCRNLENFTSNLVFNMYSTYTFANCTNLRNFNAPLGPIQAYSMFENCSNLRGNIEINVNELANDALLTTLTSYNNMFARAGNIEEPFNLNFTFNVNRASNFYMYNSVDQAAIKNINVLINHTGGTIHCNRALTVISSTIDSINFTFITNVNTAADQFYDFIHSAINLNVINNIDLTFVKRNGGSLNLVAIYSPHATNTTVNNFNLTLLNLSDYSSSVSGSSVASFFWSGLQGSCIIDNFNMYVDRSQQAGSFVHSTSLRNLNCNNFYLSMDSFGAGSSTMYRAENITLNGWYQNKASSINQRYTGRGYIHNVNVEMTNCVGANNAFSNCKNLQHIKLSGNYNGDIGAMFANCWNVETIDVSEMNIQGGRHWRMFSETNNVKEIIFTNDVVGSCWQGGSDDSRTMFANCKNCENIAGNFYGDRDFQFIFENCRRLNCQVNLFVTDRTPHNQFIGFSNMFDKVSVDSGATTVNWTIDTDTACNFSTKLDRDNQLVIKSPFGVMSAAGSQSNVNVTDININWSIRGPSNWSANWLARNVVKLHNFNAIFEYNNSSPVMFESLLRNIHPESNINIEIRPLSQTTKVNLKAIIENLNANNCRLAILNRNSNDTAGVQTTGLFWDQVYIDNMIIESGYNYALVDMLVNLHANNLLLNFESLNKLTTTTRVPWASVGNLEIRTLDANIGSNIICFANGAQDLQSVYLNMTNCVNAYNAFNSCKNLKHFEVNSGIKDANFILWNAGVEEIEWNGGNNLALQDAFYNCQNLQTLNIVTSEAQAARYGEDGNFVNGGMMNSIQNVPGQGEIYTLFNFARNCKNLTTVNIQGQLWKTNASQAFRDCSNLTDVIFSEIPQTTISLFYECSNLVNVTIPGVTNEWINGQPIGPQLQPPAITYIMNWMFYNCHNMTGNFKIDLGGLDKSSMHAEIFSNCWNLTGVELTNLKPNVVFTYNIINNCQSFDYLKVSNCFIETNIHGVASSEGVTTTIFNGGIVGNEFGTTNIEEVHWNDTTFNIDPINENSVYPLINNYDSYIGAMLGNISRVTTDINGNQIIKEAGGISNTKRLYVDNLSINRLYTSYFTRTEDTLEELTVSNMTIESARIQDLPNLYKVNLNLDWSSFDYSNILTNSNNLNDITIYVNNNYEDKEIFMNYLNDKLNKEINYIVF